MRDNRRIRVVLNGYFTSNPDSWPPSDCLDPLFVSFHVADVFYPGYPNPGPSYPRAAVDVLLQDEIKSYYKSYEPIGCRDFVTRDRFVNLGVKAYFSACLTLTLKRWIFERRDHICLVDPCCELGEILSSMPKSLAEKAIIISHDFDAKNLDVDARFALARKLLECYQTASLVITSRIHCALPCLAFGTPLIFVPPTLDKSRLPGLIQLLNCVSAKEISSLAWDRVQPNSTVWTCYARKLRKRCVEFVSR